MFDILCFKLQKNHSSYSAENIDGAGVIGKRRNIGKRHFTLKLVINGDGSDQGDNSRNDTKWLDLGCISLVAHNKSISTSVNSILSLHPESDFFFFFSSTIILIR